MKKILIIGGGAMGSAFTVPCLENNNSVTITEPYSKVFIRNLSSKNKYHSALKINLSKKLRFKKFSDNLLREKFDLIVIALSLSGIDYIGNQLRNLKILSTKSWNDSSKKYVLILYIANTARNIATYLS